jgi:hypothetical protein
MQHHQRVIAAITAVERVPVEVEVSLSRRRQVRPDGGRAACQDDQRNCHATPKQEISEKLPAIVAAGRQTAAIAQYRELSGFLPKAATLVLQWPQYIYFHG